jgi:hypothetical protein
MSTTRTKAEFSLKNFRSRVASEGLATPNRFEIELQVPPAIASVFGRTELEIVTMFCESASLPPQIVGVRPQRLYGPTIYKPFGVEYGGEGIPLSFYVDRKMNVKAFFDSWISKIVDPYQYFVYYRRQYAVTMRIYQLDNQNNVTYGVEMDDVFPRSVTLMDLNSSTQNQVHRLNVNFTYRKWKPLHNLTSRVPYPALFDEREDPRVVRNTPTPQGSFNSTAYGEDTGGVPTQTINELFSPF